MPTDITLENEATVFDKTLWPICVNSDVMVLVTEVAWASEIRLG